MKALLLALATVASGVYTVMLYIIKTEGGGRPWLQERLDTPYLGWLLIGVHVVIPCLLFKHLLNTLRRI